MGEALWADLDAWMVYSLDALTDAGAYPTLTAQIVVATLVRDYREWDNADVWQFPAIIVGSSRMARPPAGALHGDGWPHYRKTTLYSWLAVVEGNTFSAVRDAKIMEKRLETLARTLVKDGWGAGAAIPLPPDSSGERLSEIRIGQSNVAVFPRGSAADSQAKYGVASLDLDVFTTI